MAILHTSSVLADHTRTTTLRVDNIVKHFPLTRGVVFQKTIGTIKAVNGISFDLHSGETLGIVGESGCGKSTLASIIIGLQRPTHGHVLYQDRDIHTVSHRQSRRLRRDIQMVTQDPYTSLNPRMTIGNIIREPLDIHKDLMPRHARRHKVTELLDYVGLAPQYIDYYPHQLSGGQRQRVGIARALALQPKILICDEPVSALDMSIRAHIINLLRHLRDTFNLSLIFIAHDLSTVRHISDRVAVMYLGKIVEIGAVDQVYTHPRHPYTQALLSAVPSLVPPTGNRPRMTRLKGDIPSPTDPPSGCGFRTRCWKARAICANQEPSLAAKSLHSSACHLEPDT